MSIAEEKASERSHVCTLFDIACFCHEIPVSVQFGEGEFAEENHTPEDFSSRESLDLILAEINQRICAIAGTCGEETMDKRLHMLFNHLASILKPR